MRERRRARDKPGARGRGALARFQAKWRPVRVKKTRQIKNLEPRFDSIETEKALARQMTYERVDDAQREAGPDRRTEIK